MVKFFKIYLYRQDYMDRNVGNIYKYIPKVTKEMIH